MPHKTGSSECTGDYFLLNSKPTPVSLFHNKALSSGRSIYEVYRIFDGIPLFFEEHIQRLIASSASSDIKFNVTVGIIIQDTQELIRINNINYGNIKLILNKLQKEADYILYFDCHKYPSAKDYKEGIKLGLMDAERIDPNIKYVNHELRKSAKSKMKDEGYYELLLVKNNNFITEGSRSNVFFIKEGKVFTPPLQYVLPGITRNKVIEVCSFLNYEVIEKEIRTSDLNAFESGFITGTSPKVLSIKSVNDVQFKVNNSITMEIADKYDELVNEDLLARKKMWDS